MAKIKQPIGRPALPEKEKMKKVTITVSFDVWQFLKSLPNVSEYVNRLVEKNIGK